MKTDRVLSEDVDRDVSYALQQVVKNGTGSNALALGRPAAGKTGTATNDDGDVSSSWFVGYTPQLATAVMYVRGDGNDALNGYLPSYFGAEYPTRTWTDIMTRALEGAPVVDFPPPANLEATNDATGHEPLPTYTPTPTPTQRPTPTPEPSPTETDADADPDARRRRPRRRRPSRATATGVAGSACRVRARRARARPRPTEAVRRRAPHRRVPRMSAIARPSHDDPLVRAASEVIGGPVGDRAAPHPWWTPVRVVLAVAAVVLALGMVQKTPCVQQHWAGGSTRYAEMCYSDVPYLYTGRGFAERQLPFSDTGGRYQAMEYPVVIGYFAYGSALLTQLTTGWPDVTGRARYPVDSLYNAPGVAAESWPTSR